MVVREIAHAFLDSDHPEQVLQFALERVAPLVGASFASVFLLDQSDELMRLAAQYRWPERYRRFLGETRIRVGRGPSGEAAATKRPVVVPDVFASDMYADWQEVARELGFRALVALPLVTPHAVLGTLTFYFEHSGAFAAEEDGLLRIVADQMAATVEKASLIQELRRTNAALRDANVELERQFDAALEARRLKDEFLSNVSHELRTPLTSVLGYSYLLQEGMSGPLTDEQRTTLAQVTLSGERLLSLIEDLLEMAAIKRGDYRILVEEFDLRTVVEDALTAAHSPPPGVALKVQLPRSPVPVRSDRGKVLKVLVNLVGNAYKFTSKGEVSVRLERRNRTACMEVKDTGIGIPADAHELVFEEFRQVDGSPTRRYSGTGLGLALCRRLAQLLGGDIRVASHPGTGSTFTVELPLHYTPPAREDNLHVSTRHEAEAEAT